MQFHYEYGATPADRVQAVAAPREDCESKLLTEFNQVQACHENIPCPTVTAVTAATTSIVSNVSTTPPTPTSFSTPTLQVATRELGFGIV